MNKFERQLRIWGEDGQSRIEKCNVVFSDTSHKLAQEISLSLRLAGLVNIFNQKDQIELEVQERLPTNANGSKPNTLVASECVFVGIDGDKQILPPSDDTYFLIIRVRTELPVVVITFEYKRPLLILGHHNPRVPPFSLLDLEKMLNYQVQKWLSRCKNPHWALVLLGAVEMSRQKQKPLRECLQDMDLDPDCLHQARLHLSWITNAPDFAKFNKDLFGVFSKLSTDDQAVSKRFGSLGRFPICGKLPEDYNCDLECARDMSTFFNEHRAVDVLQLRLTPFFQKTGLGTLTVVHPGKLFDEELVKETLAQDDKLDYIHVEPEHHLAHVISVEKEFNTNDTILRGLKALGYDVRIPETKDFTIDPYATMLSDIFFRIFLNSFWSVTGAAISTEILKACVSQFDVHPRVVIFE